jgi:hypothetical protein
MGEAPLQNRCPSFGIFLIENTPQMAAHASVLKEWGLDPYKTPMGVLETSHVLPLRALLELVRNW